MSESAEELYRRALEVADADGRLPIPPLEEWDSFRSRASSGRGRSVRLRTSRRGRARAAPTAGAARRATARPAGMPQLKGSFAAIWDDMLPPVPEEIRRSNLDAVARALVAGGGRPD